MTIEVASLAMPVAHQTAQTFPVVRRVIDKSFKHPDRIQIDRLTFSEPTPARVTAYPFCNGMKRTVEEIQHRFNTAERMNVRDIADLLTVVTTQQDLLKRLASTALYALK